MWERTNGQDNAPMTLVIRGEAFPKRIGRTQTSPNACLALPLRRTSALLFMRHKVATSICAQFISAETRRGVTVTTMEDHKSTVKVALYRHNIHA